MLKTILEPVKIAVNNGISKLTLKKELLKHPDYAEKAKEIWEMVDKEFGISVTIENLLKLKTDKFEQVLSKRFPELSIKDIEALKKKIISETNWVQTMELSKNCVSKQLQDISVKLKEENEKLKGEIRRITSKISAKDEKKSNISNELSVEDTKLNVDNESSDEKIK